MIYKESLEKQHKNDIANDFDLSKKHMAQCLHSLSVLRNSVAHHNILYKKIFRVGTRLKWIGNKENKFHEYNFFINNYLIVCHFLSVIHPDNSWKERVDKIILSDPDIAYGYGFEQVS